MNLLLQSTYLRKLDELSAAGVDRISSNELGQLLGEKIVRLMEAGFNVQCIPLEKPCTVEVDVQYFLRVLDNLFNNIEKHADRSKRVTVMARLEAGQLMIDLVNGMPDRPNRVESTKIGLQTCRKIVQDMGGAFETQMEDGKFLAEIALPCVKAGGTL